MRVRWRPGRAVVRAAVVVGTVVVAAATMGSGAAALRGASGARPDPPSSAAGGERLQILYSPPVLVRAGERVVVPVDVVCGTTHGTACPARVSVRAAAGAGPYRGAAAAVSPGLGFDLSAAALAASRQGVGFVRFSVEAQGGGGTRTSLPEGPSGAALRFYVASSMPAVRVPAIPFDRVRRGRTVLSLPWGTGPSHAGVAVGDGDAPVGPSSFDVGRRGGIYLLDTEQSRLAVFAGGGFLRATHIPVASRSDVAVSADGTAFVLSASASGRLAVTPVDASGAARLWLTAGTGIAGAVRSVGGSAYVHVLPLDAWVRVPGSRTGEAGSAAWSTDAPGAGEPLSDGRQLLSVERGRRVRLATVVDGRVRDAIELIFRRELGEVALAEPDRAGGYLVVVHVWRDGFRPADAYQAVRVDGGRVVSTFLLPSRAYASGSPQSTVRVGPHGRLYQLETRADGLRIVRYEMGGVS